MMKLKKWVFLLGVLLFLPAMNSLAFAADSVTVQLPQADTTDFRVVPRRNTEVVDAAGNRYRLKPIAPPDGPLHSFSLEIGAMPACVDRPLFSSGECCDDIGYWNWPGEFPGEQRYYEGPLRVTDGIGVSYAYRARRWLEVGASLTYSGFYQNLLCSRDGSIATRVRDHYVTLMPYVRFMWLNRRMVHLYSSLHLGVQFSWQKSYFDRSYNYNYLAGQFTPFGIRVGRRLFGYAEIGVGMRGVFLLGIGYGFGGNAK